MIVECKPNRAELEWAVFLFNTMDEDNSYFVDLWKVQELYKIQEENKLEMKPGEVIVDFLNHWSMRATKKPIARAIDKWYTDNEVSEKLKLLPETLTGKDLNDELEENITYLYTTLDGLTGLGEPTEAEHGDSQLKQKHHYTVIRDTGASKILHILKPGFFVMWDNPIRQHYMGNCTGSGAYFSFLKKMQEKAKCLRNQNSNIFKKLFLNIKEPLEINLKNVISRNGSKQEILNFMKENQPEEIPNNGELTENTVTTIISKFIEDRYNNDGYIDAKFLDEYNWIVHTKNIKLPPAWHPSDYKA